MIQIAVCDDEKHFQHSVKEIISLYMCNKELEYNIDTFSSGKQLISLKNEERQYDIIFLDIYMDEIDGIETAKIIRESNKNVFLVFVTAHLDYSLEGYKVNAIRYLLKDNANFQDAIYECLDAIIQERNSNKVNLKFDFIEGYLSVQVDNIIFIESHLHKVKFTILRDKICKYTMYSTLNQVEEMLANYSFIRVHQSYLVNLKYITRVLNYRALITTGLEVPIPKPRYRAVKNSFIAYKGEV